MADISTTNKKARVPILGENGRISDAYLPQAVIDAEASSKTYAENAKSYSELVKKDAESAASSAASAKESADAAREGISSIDEKVTQAGQFAEAAFSSATEANNYLKQVTAVSDTVSGIASSVAENAQTAETFANKSKESAASALTASTDAVNAKVDAEGYRNSAKSYSDNAKADADTAKNILESVRAQKADVDSTVQQFNTDATEYDTKFNGYVSEAKESKEASAASAASASESAENASTSATNASTSATNANASADASALSATNAANSAKEAADNLSLFGASTLTRKEKDTFIHVDDAFPSTLLGIEIEGACRQDGTPSPDNPVPIEVVENPVLKVQGRNFAEETNISTNKDVFSGVLFVEADIKPSENYILSFDVDTAGNRYYLNEKLFTIIDFGVKKGKNYVQCRTADSISKSNPAQYSTTTRLKGWILLKNSRAQENDVQFSNVQLERGSIVSDYAPYVGTSQAFTLPPEHPYLAKLPNGTADEIVVDRDGNVELVARIGVDKNVRKVGYFNRGKYYSLESNLMPFSSADDDYSGMAFCSALPSISASTNDEGIYRKWNGVYVRDTSGRTKEEIQAEVDKNAPLTVVARIPETRYPLGKIEMPKAQDSIINVWTDAEVTPNTGIEYTRDVNIVVANLESAIASIS